MELTAANQSLITTNHTPGVYTNPETKEKNIYLYNSVQRAAFKGAHFLGKRRDVSFDKNEVGAALVAEVRSNNGIRLDLFDHLELPAHKLFAEEAMDLNLNRFKEENEEKAEVSMIGSATVKATNSENSHLVADFLTDEVRKNQNRRNDKN
jgi:hypothetical protein